MLRVVIVGMAMVGCDVVFDIAEVPPANKLPYRYRKRIVVTQREGSALEGYPLGVTRTADGDLAQHASVTGDDLVFADASAQPLDSEITSYADGNLEAWVHTSELTPGENELYLYYGGAPAPGHPDRVWSGFGGVWHMSELSIEHDLAGHHDLAPTSTAPARAAGIVGDARMFAPSADELCASLGDGSLDFDVRSFGFSVWVNIDGSVDTYDQPFYKGGASAGDPGYDMELGSDRWAAYLRDDLDKEVSVELSPTAIVHTWVYLAVMVDRDQQLVTAYVNGVPRDTAALGTLGSLSNGTGVCVGGPHPLDGRVDEIRVIASRVSDAWFATEYANFTDAEFVVVGPEEAVL